MPYIHYYIYRTIQEKYIKMYERFVNQLKEYSHAIRILSKGYLPISLLPAFKISKNITRGETSFVEKLIRIMVW